MNRSQHHYRGAYKRKNYNNTGAWKRQRQDNSQAGYSSQQNASHTVVEPPVIDLEAPYKTWHLYFPNDDYHEDLPIVTKVIVFENYLTQKKHVFNMATIEQELNFTVDLRDILQSAEVTHRLPGLHEELKDTPEVVINSLQLAMHQILITDLAADLSLEDVSKILSSNSNLMKPLHCYIINYQPITTLKHLKANLYGKFVSIRGTVVRVSNVKPFCTQMLFTCSMCQHQQIAKFVDGKYSPLSFCRGNKCKSRSLMPQHSSEDTKIINWQTIRVQEIINDDHRESGRIPRAVDCELTDNLVDSCVPGDSVTISGIVKVLGSEGKGHSSKQKDKCLFLLYVFANSVSNAKGGNQQSDTSMKSLDRLNNSVSMEFTTKELYAIEEIHAQDKLFRLITGSLCPSIYGHEMVKAGLALGLFGGRQKFCDDRNMIPVRGDPHILVVGDPGLGKSQMLQAVSKLAPRSVYVCGNTTTTSGLTVTLSRDSGSDFALEAGALVLADQGCCCIDEFDKMSSQHQALLEAMEQQCISIAKAGIVCSLPSRTSILAAANPAGGHYNKAKTVSENLRMGSALLSRFDLVFILLDKPDEEMDSMLSEHVMALHSGKKISMNGSLTTSQQTQKSVSQQQWDADKPLSDRLKLPRDEMFDPIPGQLLRKYIGYARKYVQPKLTKEAALVLQNFYLELRKKHQTRDSTPITTRQLESLIRLTEARARLELREEAVESDARDVIEIMKYSMVDTYADELGFLDFQRSQHGSGMSNRSQAKRFISILQKISERTYNSLFTIPELNKIAKDSQIQTRSFEDFIASLNNQGYLLKKGARTYQLQTAY